MLGSFLAFALPSFQAALAQDSSLIPAGAIQQSAVDGSAYSCTSAVGTDAYACTLNISPQPTAYVTNGRYILKVDVANTAAASVNFGGMGVKAIKKWSAGSKIDLATGDIGAGQVVQLNYDGTDMVATSLGGAGGAGSGTVSGLTDECIPKAGAATLIDSCSAMIESAAAITSTKDIISGDCTTNCWAWDASAVTGIKTGTIPNRSGGIPVVSDNVTGAIPTYWDIDLAAVIAGTASHVWNDDPLSTACTPTAVTGSNRAIAVCNFADTDGAKGRQITRWLPTGWTGNIDAIIWWKTTGTGNARFQIQTKCYADDEADDTAFNTASVVTAAAGTSGRPNMVTMSNITTTGCAAEELIRIRFFRDRTEASDTLNASLDVEKVIFKLRIAP